MREGAIQLPLSAEEGPNQTTVMVDFLMVDQPSTYNSILRQPSLYLLRAMVSTYHLVKKFPTEQGVGIIKVNQHDARQCYMMALRALHEAMAIESLDRAKGLKREADPWKTSS